MYHVTNKDCLSVEWSVCVRSVSKVLDNRELWGGSLLGERVLGRGRNLSLSEALR